MIPTSASSSPPAACLATIGSQMNNSPTMHGTARTSNGVSGSIAAQGQSNNSALLGIASLILEGRALADDEYATQTSRHDLKTSLSSNSSECGRQSPKPSTSRAAFGENFSCGVGNNSFSIDLVNYLGRKSSHSPESSPSSFLRDYHNSSSSESASSSIESNHSRWSQKLSQLRQESPNAYHQAIPGTQKVAVECPRGSDAEYVALAINTDHHYGTNDDRKGGDFEILRRMSINQMNFYNSPNSMMGSGVSSGGGGGGGDGGSNEHFMYSLQPLASNTCLSVGTPLLRNTTSPPRYLTKRQISPPSNRYSTSQNQQSVIDYSIGSASCSSGSSTGVSVNSWYASSSPHLSNSDNSNSCNNKDHSVHKSNITTERMPIPTLSIGINKAFRSSTSSHKAHSNTFNRNNTNFLTATARTNSSSAATANRNQIHPQQGPHCDQFLRKMGLAKGDASETEEHHCDMSYVNITCTRWRSYCIKMENILAHGESLCIEVYLGPVGHKVLLEQWIITQREKQPPPTMTLPSLCSAIRSQLYFSQISAWCDLIKKSDKTISETGRIIYTTPPTTSAAGDLATTMNNVITTATTTTSATSALYNTGISSLSANLSTAGCGNGTGSGVIGVGCAKRRPSSPRLNIFYRITQYDNIACFNSKPNVHNFPNVNISENYSVSVCLKSLPRITGGIPKIGSITTQLQNMPPTGLTSTSLETPPVNSVTPSTTCLVAKSNTLDATTSATSNGAAVAVNATEAAGTTTTTVTITTTTTTNANKSTILKMNCDNKLKEHEPQQKPFTASATSSSCSYPCSRNNSKSSSALGDIEHERDQYLQGLDFEYCDEQYNINLSAGGDNNSILCGSEMIVAASAGDCDSSNSSFSTNNCGNLSHREKQLLKYRKRMLKRDKKQQQRKGNENFSSNNQIPNLIQNRTEKHNNYKMEQGEDDGDETGHDVNNDKDGNNSDTADYNESKYSVNSLAKGQRQQVPNNHKNSIPCTNLLQQQQQHHQQQLQQQQQQQQQQNQHHHIKMISTGTQTITNTCTSCGSEKSMICLKCNPLRVNNDDSAAITTLSDSSYNYEEIMDAESENSSASSLSSSDIIYTPRNKAELLLQAIQRTPKSNKKHKHKSKDSNQMAATKQQDQQNEQEQQQHQQQKQQQNSSPTIATISSNNNLVRNFPNNSNNWNSGANISQSISRSSSTSSVINGVTTTNNSSDNSNDMVGCQMCKRQKTQHNFNQFSKEEIKPEDNNSLSNNALNSSSDNVLSKSKKRIRNNSSTGDDKTAADDDNGEDGGEIPSPPCVSVDNNVKNGNSLKKVSSAESCDNLNVHETMEEEEYFETSTKLTPHIDRCSLSIKSSTHANIKISDAPATDAAAADRIKYQSRSCSTPPLDEQKENTSTNDGTIMLSQFKTPPSGEQYQNAMKSNTQQPLQPHKHTPKPNLLHIAGNLNKSDEQQISKLNFSSILNNSSTPTSHNPLLLRRSSSKVNLTPIFCNPNSMMIASSPPIPISNNLCIGSLNDLTIKSANVDVMEAPTTFSFELPSLPPPSLTVQKSNSAPTLPNSPSLSPRFVKASAIYKRRSRHLSDRSDRSSLCSDEQISDEDIDSGMYSPFATSPVKLRSRLSAVFGRKPLLGNLEECLLQRRLVPKVEVMGFKLLLGASGGFCPTQLTIPAAAYFYELKGQTLSTPYVCEIRLPRKGYVVPRCGTVQATLLNPMGTVVRMFVIPYDMRDMPTLHQTFIRQRILADTGLQASTDYTRIGADKKCSDIRWSNSTITTKARQKKIQGHLQSKRPQEKQQQQQQQQQLNAEPLPSLATSNDQQLGHFISAENMKSLRYSIHLRFQTSRSGRLMLHTDIRLLISRRTDCDTAAAHAKGVLEAPNELITNTMMPTNPKYSARHDQTTSKL